MKISKVYIPSPQVVEAIRSRRLPIEPDILMRWVNGLLNSRFKGLQSLRSGEVFCHMLERLYPKCLRLSEVVAGPPGKWPHNYHLLRRTLRNMGCELGCDYSELLRGSPLEITFMLHQFIDMFNGQIHQFGLKNPVDYVYQVIKIVLRRNLEMEYRMMSKEQVERLDHERAGNLLFYLPVRGCPARCRGGAESLPPTGRKDISDSEQQRRDEERRQRRRDRHEIEGLIDACIALRTGQKKVIKLLKECRREKRAH
ncbi:hypothetical protein KR018_003784 [Drosophila ironensis]|nr:hypothetical protein KR018_003784 [Drosophila ironensis]